MLSSVRGRLLALVVLAGALVVLAIWFGSLAPAPAQGAYAGGSDLGPSYNRYVGEKVELAGTVVETDPLLIESKYGDGKHARFEIRAVDRPVETGDNLRVFGVAREDRVIEASNSVVVSPGGLRYAYGISALAGVWVLGRILRDWRIDRGSIGLVPSAERGAGSATGEQGGEDGDA